MILCNSEFSALSHRTEQNRPDQFKELFIYHFSVGLIKKLSDLSKLEASKLPKNKEKNKTNLIQVFVNLEMEKTICSHFE